MPVVLSQIAVGAVIDGADGVVLMVTDAMPEALVQPLAVAVALRVTVAAVGVKVTDVPVVDDRVPPVMVQL